MLFHPPRLGPGAIYLRSLDRLFRLNGDLVKVAEVEPQIFWTKGTSVGARPRGSRAELQHIAALPQSLLTHGVGNPVGGTICDHEMDVEEFRLWSRELGSAWTSEHLSLMSVHGAGGPQAAGFLMPPLQTDAGLRLAVRNIVQRSAALGLPFAFETGVNYFLPRTDEIPDGDFFASVAMEADCGILLDLTNLWINQKNGRARVTDVVAKLPLERIWEVHLAGAETERGYWVDAHCREINAETVAIAEDLICHFPNLGAIIFELAPDRVSKFDETLFLKQIEILHRLWEKAPSREFIASERIGQQYEAGIRQTQELSPESWERAIAHRMLPSCDRPASDFGPMPISRDDEERFSLYAHLAASFRTGAIAELLEQSIRMLLLAMGEQRLRGLLDTYIAETPPVAFPTDEALQFRRFLAANPLPVPGLEEMLRFEAALIEAAADNKVVHASFTTDICEMLQSLSAGLLPEISIERSETTLEIGVDPVPFVRAL